MNQPHPAKPRIAITLGDIHGIGPEVVMKTLADSRLHALFTPVIYGSGRVLSHYKKLFNLEDFTFNQVRQPGQFTPKNINVVNCWEESPEIMPGKPSVETGKFAFLALKTACEDLQKGLVDALVTAPIDKHTIHSAEFPFTGHTEYLTRFFGASQSLMLLTSEKLRIGLVTEHVPLKEVTSVLTKERIESKLDLLEQSLRRDFGIQKPRIALLAINPHAGDGGLIGTEDDNLLKPVIAAARQKGRLVFGPYPADGFFGTSSYTTFDGILAMYHDQGLIPFKTLAFDQGVNFTAGLSVVRTSPDHGTAFAIAGKNQADESSMRAAVFGALDILKHRMESSKEK